MQEFYKKFLNEICERSRYSDRAVILYIIRIILHEIFLIQIKQIIVDLKLGLKYI